MGPVRWALRLERSGTSHVQTCALCNPPWLFHPPSVQGTRVLPSPWRVQLAVGWTQARGFLAPR